MNRGVTVILPLGTRSATTAIVHLLVMTAFYVGAHSLINTDTGLDVKVSSTPITLCMEDYTNFLFMFLSHKIHSRLTLPGIHWALSNPLMVIHDYWWRTTYSIKSISALMGPSFFIGILVWFFCPNFVKRHYCFI